MNHSLLQCVVKIKSVNIINKFYFRLDLIANRDTTEESKHNSSTDSFESFSAIPIIPSVKQKSRSVIKSASTSGLSLVIPTSDFSCTYYYKLNYCILHYNVHL